MKKDVNIQVFYHKYLNNVVTVHIGFWIISYYFIFILFYFFAENFSKWKIIIKKNHIHSMKSSSKHGKVWMKKNSKIVTI